jgi:acyl carrier protein
MAEADKARAATVRAEVLDVARGLGLIQDEALVAADSIAIVDLLVGLEERFSVTIPPSSLRVERFASLDTITELVLELVP